jgi:hypothetical protein
MAKQSLQDKFQITVPYNPNDDPEAQDLVWPPNKAMRTRPVSGSYSDGLISDFSLGPKQQQRVQKNQTPEVSTIAASSGIANWTDQRECVMKEHGGMGLVTASDSDVHNQMMRAHSLKNGFVLYEMANTDDQYTGEGVDHFYGDAEGEDDAGNKYTGFVERNNYLDRE